MPSFIIRIIIVYISPSYFFSLNIPRIYKIDFFTSIKKKLKSETLHTNNLISRWCSSSSVKPFSVSHRVLTTNSPYSTDIAKLPAFISSPNLGNINYQVGDIVYGLFEYEVAIPLKLQINIYHNN